MRKKIIFLMTALSICMTACSYSKPLSKEKNNIQAENTVLMSNMSNERSVEEVRKDLKEHLSAESVDEFIKGVMKYNETIEKTGLTGDFEEKAQPVYDMLKIGELWRKKENDFIGTNCRINSFMLLKNNIEINKGNIDSALLFLDKDAIEIGKIFSEQETEKFEQLFSRVKTEKTEDVKVHAKKMEEHFSNVKFSEDAKMVSVVINDDLDGDYLFIGHVGILTEKAGKYLFVEKLSFEEPFQAIKFDKKEECYKYLFEKYKNYKSDTTATPFIMENGKFVDTSLYDGM